MNLKRRKDILTYGAMLLIGFAFYLLPGKWISVESDTIAYLSPDGREGVLPGYPVFLAFWKMILGEQYFLHGVVYFMLSYVIFVLWQSSSEQISI